MPTYQYSCGKCFSIWEDKHKIVDRKAPEGLPCPQCGEGPVIHMITPVAFGDPVKMGLSGKNGAMKEVLQKIHATVPGSRLNETSTINKI